MGVTKLIKSRVSPSKSLVLALNSSFKYDEKWLWRPMNSQIKKLHA